MTHQNIQGGICGLDELDLLNVILRGPHRKFSAQGPEFLVTALYTPQQELNVIFHVLETFGAAPKLNHTEI